MKKLLDNLKTKKMYEIIFICSVAAGILAWVIGLLYSGTLGEQLDIFFLKTNNFFADITNVIGYSAHRNPYNETYYMGPPERAYPPIVYMMAYFLSRIVDMQPYFDRNFFFDLYKDTRMLMILIIVITINVIAIYELIRSYKNGNSAIKIITGFIICLSMPMLYTVERGNFMLMTVFFELFYIFNYDSENKIRRELALIALALAAAIKLTPAVLGILLLYNKQWKEAIRVVIYGMIFGILPFLFFDGGFANISTMFDNAKLNLEQYQSTEGTTIMSALVSFGVEASKNMIDKVQVYTYILAAILLCMSLFYKEKWEVIMAVCMVLIVTPSHSGYYCILYIIPAVVAFLNAKEHSYWDLIILFALILIMNNYQSDLFKKVLSYHLATILILVVLLVRGVVRILQAINSKIKNNEKVQNA